MSEVSLEGTEDTPYNFLAPYITTYKICQPNPIEKSNSLKTLAVNHFEF